MKHTVVQRVVITKLVSAKWAEMIAFEWGDDSGLKVTPPVDDFERQAWSGGSNDRPYSPAGLPCDEEERLQNACHRPVLEERFALASVDADHSPASLRSFSRSARSIEFWKKATQRSLWSENCPRET